MSVNPTKVCIINALISLEKEQIKAELQQFQQSIRTISEQIELSNKQYLSSMQHNISKKYQKSISQYQKEIELIKQQNEMLKNVQMELLIENEDLKQKHQLLAMSSTLKQQEMTSLRKEMDQFKQHLEGLRLLNEKSSIVSDGIVPDRIVNFDEDTKCEVGNEKGQQYEMQQLQIIKEVSENQLSASFCSFNDSCLYSEDDLQIKNKEQNINENHSIIVDYHFSSEEILHHQNTMPIADYKDALQIFKMFNSRAFAQNPSIKDNPTLSNHQMPHSNDLRDCTLQEKNINIEGNSHTHRSMKNTMNKIQQLRSMDSADYHPLNQNKRFRKSVNRIHTFQDQYIQDHRAQSEHPQQQITSYHRDSIISYRSKKQNLPLAHSTQKQFYCLESTIQQYNNMVLFIASNLKNPLKCFVFKDTLAQIRYNQNFLYQGNVCLKKLLPEGYGKLLYKNQMVYQGEWINGRFEGWGKLALNSLICQGHAINSICKGDEINSVIEANGNFKEGQTKGSVLLLFLDGSRFMGSISEGQIFSEGTFIDKHQILSGNWENNKLITLI